MRYDVSYTFTPNKSYAYLLNVETSNLMILKTYNTEFDDIIITVTDQNGKRLEIEDKFTLNLLINRNEIFYRTNNTKMSHRIWIFIVF